MTTTMAFYSNKCRQLQKRLWLPPELSFELLLFMQPSKIWGVRRLLRTSAIFYRLIVGTKNLEYWRKPYSVLVIEAMYLHEGIGPLQKLPVLLRRHSSQLPFETPDTQHSFSSYFLIPNNFGPNSAIHCQVLLFLNDRKFTPALLPSLYLALSERINRVQQQLSDFYGTAYMNAVCDPQKEHVVLELAFKMTDNSALVDDFTQICSNIKLLLCFLRKYIDEQFPDEPLE